MCESGNAKRRVGVYGGTFDPPHLGHLVAAQSVLDMWYLDEVLFIPSGTPPHKDQHEVTPARHRYLMTLLATLDNPRFSTSRIELDRDAPSFTVDTLRQLRDESEEDVELFFIIGVDAILGLPTWKEPQAVLELCHMVVVGRPGYAHESIAGHLGDLYTNYGHRIHFAEIPAIEVSASDIRTRVREGASIRYLVPDMVREYIEAHGLYRNEEDGR